MVSSLSSAEATRAGEYGANRLRLDSLQEQRLKAFLETLATDQLAFLYQTGFIIDTLAEREPLPQADVEMSFPDASEHKPFDFEEWKNQKDHQIR